MKIAFLDTLMTNLLNKLFQYVLLTTTKYKIDESHGLSHAMNILTIANNIYSQELPRCPDIKKHENIIYISAALHDMCDKKYMNQTEGLEEMEHFIKSLNVLQDKEVDVVQNIVSTMSYSYVKKHGFPDLGEYQTAYNIVREADLLCAYDFDRCMIYSMYRRQCSIQDAFDDACDLFQQRVFCHNHDGLFFTQFAQNNHLHYENGAHVRIAHWKKILRKPI